MRDFGRAVAVLILLGLATSARADLFQYGAHLDGPSEDPVNASPGVGTALVDYDSAAHTLRVQVSFVGLTSGTTAAHIHAPTPDPFTGTAGVATTTPTFAGFPLGVTAGSYDNTLDLTSLSSYNPAYVTANGGTAALAEAALTAALADGKSYLNIHTTQFPRGEIRGFLRPVPEPSSLLLLGGGSVAVLALARRRARG